MRRIWITAAAMATVFAAVAIAGPGDKSVRLYRVGVNPATAALGDFNRDGRVDMAVTNFAGVPDADLSLTILRGKAAGTFKPVRTIVLPEQPDAVAAGRIGADRDLDLIVGSFGDVLRFDGRKGMRFKAQVPIEIDDGPRQVALADFDADGGLDIAATLQDATDLAIRLAADGGGFEPTVTYPGARTSEILTARLAGDGRLDIVTRDGQAETLVVFRGQPGGTFAAAEPFAAGLDPTAVAVADLNRDGRPDLIAGREGASGQPTRISVLRGTDSGFAAPELITVAGRAFGVEHIAVTKLDSDRDPDLILVGQAEAATPRTHARGGFGDADEGRVLAVRGRAGIEFRRARITKLRGRLDFVTGRRIDRGGHRDAVVPVDQPDGRRGRVAVLLNP